MCLHSHNSKPLVCNKDLTVYKTIRRKGSSILASYQNEVVRLGEINGASSRFPELPSDYSKSIVTSGVVHASLMTDFAAIYYYGDVANREVKKAVIKAGTPFYVDNKLWYIAAEKLYVSKEYAPLTEGKDTELEETRKILHDLLLEQDFMTGENGVRVGDALLSDRKTFVHKDEITSEMNVIGVVGFIRPDGKPQVVGLNQGKKAWYGNQPCRHKQMEGNTARYSTDASIDFMGYEHTKKFGIRDVNVYPAFGYCLEYSTEGTEKGDWYLPSSGELLQTMRNCLFVNETIDKVKQLNQDKEINRVWYTDCYVSSTECKKDSYVWGVSYNSVKLYKVMICKECYVLPFLHLS